MAGRHFEEGPESEGGKENEENRCWRGFKDGQNAKKNGEVEEWTAGKDFLRWGERKGEMKRKATRKDLTMDTLEELRSNG
jgi:hypothetical protein